MDGSMGFLPRRLMVLDEDFDRAQNAAARRRAGMPIRERNISGRPGAASRSPTAASAPAWMR